MRTYDEQATDCYYNSAHAYQTWNMLSRNVSQATADYPVISDCC